MTVIEKPNAQVIYRTAEGRILAKFAAEDHYSGQVQQILAGLQDLGCQLVGFVVADDRAIHLYYRFRFEMAS